MRTLKWWLALAVVAAVAVWYARPRQAGVQRITQAEFRALQASGHVLVVDVRDLESFRQGHIPGAVLVGLDQLQAHLADLKRAQHPIVTYCA